MTILLNGQPTECEAGESVAELVQRLQLAPETILVERNSVALHRREWADKKLEENDRIEILRVSAGG